MISDNMNININQGNCYVHALFKTKQKLIIFSTKKMEWPRTLPWESPQQFTVSSCEHINFNFKISYALKGRYRQCPRQYRHNIHFTAPLNKLMFKLCRQL